MGQFEKIIAIVLSLSTWITATPLDFHFPDDLSWKAVFDRGFRPKHISGLERKKSQCIDQELNLHYGGYPAFALDRGRLMFELQSDDSLRIVEHVSRVPITMEEGEQRLNLFNEMFADCLIRRGTMPPLVDPKRGSIMTVGDFSAVAQKDGYTVHYYFTGAMNVKSPLLPILMISLKHRMDIPRLPIRRKIVEPPAGYEWYSMDPKVHTPDPGSEATATSPAPPNPPRYINGMSSEDDSAKTGWGVKRTLLSIATAAACLIALFGWLVWRSFSNPAPKSKE